MLSTYSRQRTYNYHSMNQEDLDTFFNSLSESQLEDVLKQWTDEQVQFEEQNRKPSDAIVFPYHLWKATKVYGIE